MSLKTWRAEFYPETAKQAAKRGDIAATEHSLRKWLGLRAGALEKHGVSQIAMGIQDAESNSFWFGATTCALCVRHIQGWCLKCPLAAVTGAQCGSAISDDDPYSIFEANGNPNPMIAALRKTLRRLKAQARRKA